MGRSNIISSLVTITSEKSLFNDNKTITDLSYSLLEADNGYIIYLDNTLTITVTIPSGLSAGFNCTLVKQGIGNVSVVAGGGVIIEANVTDAIIQYEGITLYHKGSDTYNIFG